MNARAAAGHTGLPPAVLQAPLEASDDFDEARHAPLYCPTDLLADFARRMAAHGRHVQTAVMLGDRDYAMWQLACARTLGDDGLTDAATRLFLCFADTPHASPLPWVERE